MPLYLWDSELLVVGDDLAIHENCCCEDGNCYCCLGTIQWADIVLSGVTDSDCPDICPDVDGTYRVLANTESECSSGVTYFDFDGTCADELPFRLVITWQVLCFTDPFVVWVKGGLREVNSGGVSWDDSDSEVSREVNCSDLVATPGTAWSAVTPPSIPLCDFTSATVSITFNQP